MKKEEHRFSVEVYSSIDELKQDYAYLLSEARAVTKFAYAPYSDFKVGAVARLVNGEVVTGTNQENAAFPAGICAERSLLSVAASQHPGIGIDTLAISYNNMKGSSDKPISPCGVCRQSLAEFAERTNKGIRLILSGMTGEVQIIENALDLLPLSFGSEDLNK